VIDDVRIEGRVSNDKELRTLRTQIPARAPGTDGVFGNNSAASGDNVCTAAQVAGTYRSENNLMPCESQGGDSVSCCYGTDCSNTLNLTVATDGRSAAGSWQQPGGANGSASFQIDESCSLASGQWGYGTAAATRPWDTTGVVARVDGLTATPDSGGSGGGISPPSGRVVIPGPVEQIEESAEDALPSAVAETAGPALGNGISAGDIDYQSPTDILADAESSSGESGSSGDQHAGSGQGETTTQQQALTVAETAVPIGDGIVSGLSGFAGTSRQRVDLKWKFLGQIIWREKSDRPCDVELRTIHGHVDPVRLSICNYGIMPGNERSSK